MNKHSPQPPDVGSGLRWLVCPACRAELRIEEDAICCQGCGRRFPVVDGIPILLVDRAL